MNTETAAGAGPVERPVRPSCKECAMWQYIDVADYSEGSEDESVGTCHRFPPVQKQENEALFQANGSVLPSAHSPREWAQPITLSTDWCGEFKPKP